MYSRWIYLSIPGSICGGSCLMISGVNQSFMKSFTARIVHSDPLPDSHAIWLLIVMIFGVPTVRLFLMTNSIFSRSYSATCLGFSFVGFFSHVYLPIWIPFSYFFAMGGRNVLVSAVKY